MIHTTSSRMRNLGKYVVSIFIIVSFITAPVYIAREGVRIQEAHATISVFDAVNAKINGVIALASNAMAGSTYSLVTKEYVLDFVVWSLVNKVLEGMLQSTINWINSGFQGKPMYISDLGNFMGDVADYIAEDFLMKHLNALCSPYTLNIKLALEYMYINHYRDYEVQCRLSDAVDNLEGYLSGDFINGGGWDTWYEVALTPSNNIYGALIEANATLYNRINFTQAKYSEMLNRTGNFLDLKKCDDNGGRCETVTPGIAINHQLNKALGSGQDRLEAADEIDEIISALFAQLVSAVLDPNGGGVRGLNSPQGPNGSYFDNLNRAQKPTIQYPPIPPYSPTSTTPLPYNPNPASPTPYNPYPTPSTGSATISATDCPRPGDGCISTYTWTSTGVSALSVRTDGYQKHTSPASGSGTVYLQPTGTHRFEVYDGTTLLASDTVTSNCQTGTTWDGFICKYPTDTLPAPTGFSVTPGACGTTDVILSWNPTQEDYAISVYMKRPDEVEFNDIMTTSARTVTTYTLNNTFTSGLLTPGSRYDYKARIISPTGQSAFTPTVTVTTPRGC